MRSLSLLLLIVPVVAVSCGRAPEAKPAPVPAAAATHQQVFQMKGLVIAVRPARHELEIKHEAVPNYMPAMTMPFEVRDTNELAGLLPGDAISFQLNTTDTEAWIDRILKVALAGTNRPPAAGSVRLVREVVPLQVGDALPDYRLTNQVGEAFNTAYFRGQAWAVTFLFTRCPFPTFCPRMANNFAEAQQKLLARTNGPANWQLLTVSFDPEFDRPEVLKIYAQSHQYDPAHWTFATGDLTEITALAEQFGMVFWHDETGSISHNLRTAVVDVSGKVTRLFVGNDWTSDELVAELIKAAAK